jgi:hypothetical protein
MKAIWALMGLLTFSMSMALGAKSSETWVITLRHSSIYSDHWVKKKCENLGNSIQAINQKDIRLHCLKLDSMEELHQFKSEKLQSLNADYHLNLEQDQKGEWSVTVNNLKHSDPQIPSETGWKIAPTTEVDLALTQRLEKSLVLFQRAPEVKRALIEVILEDQKLEVTGDARKDEATFQMTAKGSNRVKAMYLMAGTQMLIQAGIGYWGYNQNAAMAKDWDYPENFKSNLKDKITLGSKVRYDDNSIGTNIGHTHAGVLYYTICRGNGLNAYQSYLCGVAGSLAWELVTEWKEVFSINDHIFTTHGGAIVGEALHQLGRYIFARGPSWIKKSVGSAWSGPRAFSDWANKKVYGQEIEPMALDEDIMGKFELEVALVKYNGLGQRRVFALNNEVTHVPLLEEAGQSSQFIKDIAQTDFFLEAPLGTEFFHHYELFTKVVWAAYHQKKIQDSGNGLKDGYSFYIGPSVLFTQKMKQACLLISMELCTSSVAL